METTLLKCDRCRQIIRPKKGQTAADVLKRVMIALVSDPSTAIKQEWCQVCLTRHNLVAPVAAVKPPVPAAKPAVPVAAKPKPAA